MRTLKLFAAFVLLTCIAAPCLVIGDEAFVSGANPRAQFADRMEALLRSLTNSSYQHTTQIDEASGQVNCDCSGLVGFVLRHSYPEAYVSLQGAEAPWRKRPLSVTYYETFVYAGEKPGGCWQCVTRLSDARPGDVLAWRKKNLKAGSTTGHTCMIAGKPEIVGEGQIRVRLIDSNSTLLENDTRGKGETGMGAGYKTFLVDADGKCVGYLIGERKVASSIAIGRLVQPEENTSHADDMEFIGLTTKAAAELAKQRKRSWRIIRQDGEPKPPGMAIQDDRLNFVIENNQVIRVLRG